MTARRVVRLALAAVTCACGDSTGPRTGPVGPVGISIVAGAGVTDTIDAHLAQALVVSVRDDRGQVAPNTVVRFWVLPIAGAPWPAYGALVGPLSSQQMGTFIAVNTDADGRAGVIVQLGTHAGDVGVEITVPELGKADTARYTVRSGAVSSIVMTPSDTAVEVGGQYPLSAQPVDRHGNSAQGAVQVTLTQPGVADFADGKLTGKAFGRAAVIAASDVARDTAWVSVVPSGVLGVTAAGPTATEIATVRLDGSGFQRIGVPRNYTGAGLAWAPDGSYLVGGFDAPSTLYRVRLDGSSAAVLKNGTTPGQVTTVDVSTDGQSIYFSAGNCNYNEIVYRVAVTDSVFARVSAPVGDDCYDMVQADVSLAPDGTRAAVDHYPTAYDAPTLQVLDLASGIATPLGIAGAQPKWSPLGDRIAYVANGRVWTVKPDGTGAVAVSPLDVTFKPGLTWSPDGQWLAVHVQSNQWYVNARLALLRLATGELIMLPSSMANYGNPVWKPVP